MGTPYFKVSITTSDNYVIFSTMNDISANVLKSFVSDFNLNFKVNMGENTTTRRLNEEIDQLKTELEEAKQQAATAKQQAATAKQQAATAKQQAATAKQQAAAAAKRQASRRKKAKKKIVINRRGNDFYKYNYPDVLDEDDTLEDEAEKQQDEAMRKRIREESLRSRAGKGELDDDDDDDDDELSGEDLWNRFLKQQKRKEEWARASSTK